jgi:hypothetical protein
MADHETKIDNSPRALAGRVYQAYFAPAIEPEGWHDVRAAITWLALLVPIRFCTGVLLDWSASRLVLSVFIAVIGASLVSYLVHLLGAARGWRGEA